MKQQITQEQLDTLSIQATQKYIDWYDAQNDWLPQSHDSILQGKLPLPTIGQMIQFLDKHITVWGDWWKIECTAGRVWRVQHRYRDFNVEGTPELCDALWEAVKAILQQE